MGRLDNKVAVVTGGGSGIGRATAKLLAREGACVAVADYVGTAAEQTVAEIIGIGGRAIGVAGDVSRWADMDPIVSSTVQQWSRLDIMVNNAGVLDDYKNAVDTDESLWDRILSVNLKGVWLGCKRAIQQFQVQGSRGAIVNTAFIAGIVAMGGGVAYMSSKFGVVGLTKQIAAEFAGIGVLVNAIAPGGTVTGMTREIMNDPAVDALVSQNTPLGRWAQPEEMANAVLWLASDDASYVTGHVLVVDGGWTVK